MLREGNFFCLMERILRWDEGQGTRDKGRGTRGGSQLSPRAESRGGKQSVSSQYGNYGNAEYTRLDYNI